MKRISSPFAVAISLCSVIGLASVRYFRMFERRVAAGTHKARPEAEPRYRWGWRHVGAGGPSGRRRHGGRGRRDGWHGRDDDRRRWQHDDGHRRHRGIWWDLGGWRRRHDRWWRWWSCGNGAGRDEWIERRTRRRGGWQRQRWRGVAGSGGSAAGSGGRVGGDGGLPVDGGAPSSGCGKNTSAARSAGSADHQHRRHNPLLPAQRPQRRLRHAAAARVRVARLRHEQRRARGPLRLHRAVGEQGDHRVAAG